MAEYFSRSSFFSVYEISSIVLGPVVQNLQHS